MKYITEIFLQFLMLGCVSFGGPAAHIAYFRRVFVEQKKWLQDSEYNNLVALSQFLPGPGSSQVGFAIGHQRAGVWGGIAAFLGFTLPSFILLVLVVVLSDYSQQHEWVGQLVYGLKLLAVVVVADAIFSMFTAFCKGPLLSSICFITAAILILQPTLMTQLTLIALAACCGILFKNTIPISNTKQAKESGETTPFHQINWVALALFGLLFVGLPFFAGYNEWFDLAAGFFTTGSLVFGGGHVVLPLLNETVGSVLSEDSFLLGYAAAQAVPGPMFTFAGYLGAALTPTNIWLGAIVATIAIFMPGFLLIVAVRTSWQTLSRIPNVNAMSVAINASVVGLLIAAFYSPVATSALHNNVDIAIVLLGFMLLRFAKLPILYLIFIFVLTGLLIA